MTQSDDKPRGINAREASRLRATLGSEPSSGYAFHDAARVERVRSGRPGERGHGQVASHAPHEATFKQTLVGVTAEALAAAAREHASESATANDQGLSPGSPSWPPLPNIPNELIEVVATAAPAPLAQLGTPPLRDASQPPTPSVSSAPPVGGAIWQALPSVVEAPVVMETTAAADTVPVAAPEVAAMRNASAQNGRPQGWRGSLEELDTSAGAYGDARVPKYEALVARGAWEQLQVELGREAELSPALELLRIIARRETLPNDERQNAAQLSQEAISLLARILNLPEASPTALLLGKRLLRKNPGWSRARTPSTGLSASMLLAGIAVGAGIGWLVTRLIL